MAERSYFWDTTGSGDTDTLAQQDATRIFGLIFSPRLSDEGGLGSLGGVIPTPMSITPSSVRGVLRGYVNELAVSGNTSPLSVATGGALVAGFWYVSDAVTSVTIATPASATRIDLLVLRASYLDRTVRITSITGTEGGSAPSLVRIVNEMWDIPLAQLSITTGGAITVTDQRSFAMFATRPEASIYQYGTSQIQDASIDADAIATDAVATAKLAANAVNTAELDSSAVTNTILATSAVTATGLASDAVTTAKILNANVTAAKLAANAIASNLSFQRQGGNASNWSTTGTTSYTPTNPRTQVGRFAWNGTATLTWPVAFSNTPWFMPQNRELIAMSYASLGSSSVALTANSLSVTSTTTFASNIIVMYDSVDIGTSGVVDLSTNATLSLAPELSWIAIGEV